MSEHILRDYQQRAVSSMFEWFGQNQSGNPCLVLPTGSGKSHIVAAICKTMLQEWPYTRVLMLTHQKELIEQNAEKMLHHWPNAPMGIYSAGLRKRDLGQPITFASIGSVRSRADEIGHVDLVLVDEAHRISGRREGGYRNLLAALAEINPAMRVVGLTATPYRLGQGMITDGDDALFHALIEPVAITELINAGYLSPLKSKSTETHFDVSGVRKRGGEFVERDLQEAVSDEMTNRQAVAEIVARGTDCKHWIVFCTGVAHAEQVARYLREDGIVAECLTGETPAAERARMLQDFKDGKIHAMTNCDVLTTGFDHPGIDLIALMRPTMSPGLYVQMVGRGLRISEDKSHCMVLDFATNIERHGAITAVQPPRKPGEQGGGAAPVKECPECAEIVGAAVMVCPDCGHVWPEPERKYKLSDLDIMGVDNAREMEVTDWNWAVHTSRSSGRDLLRVTYYGALSDEPVSEYICFGYPGYAGQKAMATLAEMSRSAGLRIDGVADGEQPTLEDVADAGNRATPPATVRYEKEGKFNQVRARHWAELDA